jgi:altronate dehydratase small subunit
VRDVGSILLIFVLKGGAEFLEALQIKKEDNVATALKDIAAEEKVSVGSRSEEDFFTVRQAIPYGHKFATRQIEKGDNILKYGEIIGRATERIEAGAHVHVHNVESLRGRGDWGKD